MKRPYDCPPTLTDLGVLDFCKKGFLLLDGVVPDEINRRTLAYLDERKYPHAHEPTEILDEDWFMENVICNPAAAGAVRSLLGKDFGLPILVSNHRVECPSPMTGGWHRDGGALFEHALRMLQVFYYPQDTPVELGPTELLPGSHFIYAPASRMGHYGSIRGGVAASSRAGSIFITAYPIWHRRSGSTATGVRHMLKYNYFRAVPPERDWVANGEDISDARKYTLGGPTFREQFKDCRDAAALFIWLCGRGPFSFFGGQAWPSPGHFNDHQYGYPLDDLK